ncbi:hypothetical protein AVEN_32612-1 [Araneus ventricosus]|uniref:Uncharacterized protein n=1 Tax=Araneus ventricosus TaxID=182803 RepID=A0A4Y2C7W7_ARAVE|nr:hypothetical protein AVEN_32612-1 [Araneus ventricosus]
MPETGPLTRSMDKQFEKLFAMMAGLEQKMEAGQEEMRCGQEMRSKQERLEQVMQSGQEEIKNQIQAHIESHVDEIKIHVDGCIGKIEEEVQCVKEIDKVESKVQEKIGNLERSLSELEDRPNNF